MLPIICGTPETQYEIIEDPSFWKNLVRIPLRRNKKKYLFSPNRYNVEGLYLYTLLLEFIFFINSRVYYVYMNSPEFILKNEELYNSIFTKYLTLDSQ